MSKGGPTGMLNVRRTSFSLTRSLPVTFTAAILVPSRAGPGRAGRRKPRSTTPAASSLARIAGRAAFVAS